MGRGLFGAQGFGGFSVLGRRVRSQPFGQFRCLSVEICGFNGFFFAEILTNVRVKPKQPFFSTSAAGHIVINMTLLVRYLWSPRGDMVCVANF